ncbi:LamG domain-containing protein, partial [Bacteroidales bacterium OttesenSCG-928-L03]|nr:LamG domain-containing protein [Bacteroidales bacterium OttesenSCG-928-L03]
GVIMESEVKLDVSAGLNFEQTWTNTNETSQTVTFTERFKTSDNPLYVGHYGDVFIGNSTNIQYGLTKGISIQRSHPANAFSNSTDYSIAPSVSVAYGQTFDTDFAYTQIELEEITIPKWKENLKNLLLPKNTAVNKAAISSPVYVSNLEEDDINFGKINTDKEAFGNAASAADKFHNGPSYTIHFPNDYDMSLFTVDSVMFFNNQINGWTEILRQNEEEKVNMKKLGNYSFGAGAIVEWSKETTSSKTSSSTFHWVLNPTIGLNTGADVMGIGLDLETSIEYIHEEDNTSSTTEETNILLGFVLEEEGDDDEITLDYGMTESGTIAFKSRGGRTSCPYEDGYTSIYFEPGKHILDEATMQIEVPVIDINGADRVLNVPANKTAKFTIDMKNESETGEDVWFQLIVNDKTNPHGAELKIDGGVIGNGRMFLVRAGEVLQKTLTVGKGTADNYEKIGLILRSECQSDPTNFLPVIADTTYVSVQFTPACSDVNIKSPTNNWIVNTSMGDKLQIILDGFERDYANFGYIALEARKKSAPDWNRLMTFYSDEKIYNNATGLKTLISPADANIVYVWDMSNETDGAYELRARAVCVNVDDKGVILSTFSESISDVVSGVRDMTRPEPLGFPAPANGILAAGDELSISFNEEIQTAMLTKNNFTITGLLNEATIAEPNTGLYFNGTGSAYTELPISANGSFSIEGWFKRENGTAGTLFSYGQSDNYISLGFDASGRAVVKVGDKTQTSTTSISSSNTWKYIGLAYNRDNKTVSVYGFQDSDPTILFFADASFANEPPVSGKLYVGNTNNSDLGFRGAIARVHLYNKEHTDAEMSLAKSTAKSGTEPYLIGLWELDEAEGTMATDKARSRGLILNTGWYIYPAGRSLSFNGVNQYTAIPSETFSFPYYDDFTIELQFRGETQNAATILSIGTSAYIGFDADHKLILTAGEKTQVLTSKNLLDGQWHHLALSVKRYGTATAIIDGAASVSFSSTLFAGAVGGGFYNLGFHYFEDWSNGTIKRTQYFKGNIDELRVWDSALSTAIVNKNRKYKLSGTEPGLISYYPFETWDSSGNVNNSSVDLVNSARSISGNGVFDNTTSAGVVNRPPVVNLRDNYTFTASNNKIVFNITEELYRIEGVTLDITVENITDMYGNKSKPVIWTALVNKNPLNWLSNSVDLVMEEGAETTFKASIHNSSASAVDYYIDGLPTWLSVNAASGTLQALTTKELTFTVPKGTNTGRYEASLALTGISGVKKILPVSLKVTGNQPDWSVNPHDYVHSMSVIGLIQREGVAREDEDDILAAFIGDECIGIAKPSYTASLNGYYVFMDIYGNSQHDREAINFKFWDAASGRVYPRINTSQGGNNLTVYFASGETKYAQLNQPVIFNAQDMIEQSIDLAKGWNWISMNVASDNPDLLSQFKANVGANCVEIKSQNAYLQPAVMDGNIIWAGGLSSLSEKESYLVSVENNQTLKVSGRQVNVANTPIGIAKGWNWIGYTPQFNSMINTALAGIEAREGDQIKAQTGFSVYSHAIGWTGSLKYMQPGMGYMYYSENNNAFTFLYPSVTAGLRSGFADEETDETYWTNDYRRFANSMTFTTIVYIGGQPVRSNDLELAGFVDGDCRGNIVLSHTPGLPHEYLGFLMVYGENGERIKFKAYDH